MEYVEFVNVNMAKNQNGLLTLHTILSYRISAISDFNATLLNVQ